MMNHLDTQYNTEVNEDNKKTRTDHDEKVAIITRTIDNATFSRMFNQINPKVCVKIVLNLETSKYYTE